ncbi:MAG: dienelactone hydrolase family protein [Ktedonobacteraceae bacterium]|nr:dienelactone hydrolase family protein [Ktedonobacteraceae bacterium]
MSQLTLDVEGPHHGRPVFTAGKTLAEARAAMILLHGRGAGADDILALAEEFGQTDFAYIAPEATDNTWYPNSFLAPLASNEPWLSSALAVIPALLTQIEAAGIPTERIALLGFSQGACLTLESVARNAKRYGAAIGLSGGLIGPAGTPRNYKGSLAGTPVFLGCSDRDAHIPKARVEESAVILRNLGGEVDARIYPNMGHTVNRDEISAVKNILAKLIQA